MRLEKRDCALDGFFGRSGGNLTQLEVIRLAAHGTNELAPTSFYSSDTWHVFQFTPNPATIKTSMKLNKTSTSLCLVLAAGLSLAQQPPAKPATAPPSLANPADNNKPAATVPPEAVVVTIGTEKITRAQFEQILSALAENGRAATTPAAKRQV